MCVLCRYAEYIALNGGSHLISSAEGVQREVGASLPLGVVATATILNRSHQIFNWALTPFIEYLEQLRKLTPVILVVT